MPAPLRAILLRLCRREDLTRDEARDGETDSIGTHGGRRKGGTGGCDPRIAASDSMLLGARLWHKSQLLGRDADHALQLSWLQPATTN